MIHAIKTYLCQPQHGKCHAQDSDFETIRFISYFLILLQNCASFAIPLVLFARTYRLNNGISWPRWQFQSIEELNAFLMPNWCITSSLRNRVGSNWRKPSSRKNEILHTEVEEEKLKLEFKLYDQGTVCTVEGIRWFPFCFVKTNMKCRFSLLL